MESGGVAGDEEIEGNDGIGDLFLIETLNLSITAPVSLNCE